MLVILIALICNRISERKDQKESIGHNNGIVYFGIRIFFPGSRF